MLIWSLVIMGVASTAIGFVPTYDRIGVWAPVLLVALRFIQGFGVGGEWGGAVLLAVEHSGGNRRGLHGSWPQIGVPAGLLLSTGLFALISAKLSNEAFLAWGWRIPFLLSIVLVGIGLFIRLSVAESPAFREIERQGTASRTPLLDAIKRHPREVLVGIGMRFAQNVLFYLFTVFVPGYGEKTLHYPRSTMLGGVLIASVVGLVSIPFWSYLSDRIGRKPVYLAGGIVSLLFAIPFFQWIEHGPAWVAPAIVIGMIGHDMMYGPMAAYFSELFGASVRYSGASLIYQLTSVFAGGLAPFIATLLLARHGIHAVALYVMGCCLLTVIATLFAPETSKRSLAGST